MLRLYATVVKEFLVLLRDRSGLAILFIMPVALVTLMALIQDSLFRDHVEMRIPALVINRDGGLLGEQVLKGLQQSDMFEVDLKDTSDAFAKHMTENGTYEIALVIPDKASEKLKKRVTYFVAVTMQSMGITDSIPAQKPEENFVEIYFRPGVKKSFRNLVMSSIQRVSNQLESQALIDAFREEFNSGDVNTTEVQEPFGDFISFRVNDAGGERQARELNSVQHNVPAWTLFGMFFIVISLSGSLIREREEGSYLRILTMPGSYTTVLFGKIIAYLAVCMVQFVLMISVGLFLLPLFGLPQLIIGNQALAILLTALCSGLAATGFGVLSGTMFHTHQQASVFGAVSVVILAALGGIWIPIYVMPGLLSTLAEFSPLYWGLTAFQVIFIGEGGLAMVSGYLFKLFLFFAITLLLSLLINNFRNN